MLSENPEKRIFSISNKWLVLIVVLVAGLRLIVGYILVPLLEPTQTGSVLVPTNNTTNGNNTISPSANVTNVINNNSTQNTNINPSSAQTKISPAEAQNIAATYIQVSGATAGTLSLVKQDNKMVYVVPVIKNGNNVGEIDIDAQTGANLGGAGGAP
jgi:hypothetical protein